MWCDQWVSCLGPPAIGALSHRFFFGWEGSSTKIDHRKKGTLILTSVLEDLFVQWGKLVTSCVHGL